jgi:hypothetical protein
MNQFDPTENADGQYRKHVERCAAEMGWKDTQGEGALEYIKRYMHALGIEDSKKLQVINNEPVMVYHGRHTVDCGEHGSHDTEMLKMIPSGTLLYAYPLMRRQVPLSLREDQWLYLAQKHAGSDWDCKKPDGFLESVKALVLDAEKLGLTSTLEDQVVGQVDAVNIVGTVKTFIRETSTSPLSIGTKIYLHPQPKVQPLTEEEKQWLTDNPNRNDIVEFVEGRSVDKKEPILSEEMSRALSESSEHAESEEYFKWRSSSDNQLGRRIFSGGFFRGWAAARKILL